MADLFIEIIRMFYHYEDIYDKEGLTPEERGKRRQGLETKELLIRLRSLLLAERAIRPLTTQRKNMIHFGSDEGAKMAAVYHSIIATVKLQGKSVWEYLGKFFVKIVEGCRDFASLLPKNIGLQLPNC